MRPPLRANAESTIANGARSPGRGERAQSLVDGCAERQSSRSSFGGDRQRTRQRARDLGEGLRDRETGRESRRDGVDQSRERKPPLTQLRTSSRVELPKGAQKDRGASIVERSDRQ